MGCHTALSSLPFTRHPAGAYLFMAMFMWGIPKSLSITLCVFRNAKPPERVIFVLLHPPHRNGLDLFTKLA